MTRDRLLALLKRCEQATNSGDEYAPACAVCELYTHAPDCELKAAIDWLERQPAGTDVLAAEPMSQRIYDDDAPDGSSYEMRTIWQSPRPPRNGGL
jgi:hypothetical protein